MAQWFFRSINFQDPTMVSGAKPMGEIVQFPDKKNACKIKLYYNTYSNEYDYNLFLMLVEIDRRLGLFKKSLEKDGAYAKW